MGTNLQNDVQDINLSVLQKKKFRIDGDDNRILELDVSDMNIVVRLRNAYPKLEELTKKISEMDSDDSTEDEDALDESIKKLGNSVEEIDNATRDLLDYIFDSNVSEICAPSGSMYDMINGEFRYEHILNVLTNLYEQNIDKEYKKMKNRIRKHTDKYTGK